MLLSEHDDPNCLNCDTPAFDKIAGEFTDEAAEKLETAYSDQTQ